MAYTFNGFLPILGRNAVISVSDDNELSGDAAAVERFLTYASLLEGIYVGWETGPGGEYAHLADPYRILFMLRTVFAEDAIVTGNPPYPPDLPEGAIA